MLISFLYQKAQKNWAFRLPKDRFNKIMTRYPITHL